jgi:hypothetical protein
MATGPAMPVDPRTARTGRAHVRPIPLQQALTEGIPAVPAARWYVRDEAWGECGFCRRMRPVADLCTRLRHPGNGVVRDICTECFSDRLRVTTGTLTTRREAAARLHWAINYLNTAPIDTSALRHYPNDLRKART